tara:strand:+ start:297 stop:473 length:177 start_codon:yes stop_codon:yes gene_type:complete
MKIGYAPNVETRIMKQEKYVLQEDSGLKSLIFKTKYTLLLPAQNVHTLNFIKESLLLD